MKYMKRLLAHPLTYITLLALFLRTYSLSTIPKGFHVDSARAGWNAYTIMRTGADDWGHRLPLHYNSIGDHRPTGYFYATIPFITLLGNTLLAIRLPAALAGTLTIPVLYFFVQQLTTKSQPQNEAPASSPTSKRSPANGGAGNFETSKLCTLAALLLTFSAWHISLSRAAAEGIVALFLTLIGLLFFIKIFKKKNAKDNWKLIIGNWTLAIILLSLSYLFYHSARLLTPFMTLATAIYLIIPSLGERGLGGVRRSHALNNEPKPKTFIELKLQKSVVISLFSIVGLTALLTAAFILDPATTGRFSQISIFVDPEVKFLLDKYPIEEGPDHVLTARLFHNKLIIYTSRFIDEYVRYFSPQFLISSNLTTRPYRYATIGIGALTYIEYLLFLIGLTTLARNKFSKLPFFLLLMAPIPAALTTEAAPNLHRSVYMIPFLATISALGISQLSIPLLGKEGLGVVRGITSKFGSKTSQLTSIINNLPLYRLTVLLLYCANFIYFVHNYTIHNRSHQPIPISRNVGVTQTINHLIAIKDQYDHIYLTHAPDDLYPWYGYLTYQNPHGFKPPTTDRGQPWQFENITFSAFNCHHHRPELFDQREPNQKILAVSGEGCQLDPHHQGWKKVYEVPRPGGGTPYTFLELTIHHPDEPIKP
jgi:hypothetical protein